MVVGQRVLPPAGDKGLRRHKENRRCCSDDGQERTDERNEGDENDVACSRDRHDETPVQPEELANLSWSLATITEKPRALNTLQHIRKSGGGEGQLCTQHHFMRWAEDTRSAEMDAMVCVRPVSFHRLSQVTFLPLGLEASYPLNVSYLKQHPYEFLETMVGQVDRALQNPLPIPPLDGLRPGQS
ncbi:MAG: hypothetical protein EOP83_28990 [Verrucomicrobiaceae bacterium]|nr:MAG: hypothetical protein EOP83_28990 [Verrucomicrobiaceae bacterium]